MTPDEQTVRRREDFILDLIAQLEKANKRIAELEEENESLREHLRQATADLEGHQARPSALYARKGGKRQ